MEPKNPVRFIRNLVFVLVFGLAVGLAGLFVGTTPARADSPVFVRPGGDDSRCTGTADRDYSPAVAPACAVKSLAVALDLAGPGGSVIVFTGDDTATIWRGGVPGPADVSAAATTLTVSKEDALDPVLVGTPLTYTVRITNTGASAATEVLVIDVLPLAGVVTYQSATPSQGTCGLLASSIISCTLGILNSSANAVITVVVTPTAAGLINNLVNVVAQEATSVSDNAFTRIEGVTNLSVVKSDNPDPVILGRPLTYTITVSNSGPSAAAGVSLSDSLPGSVLFQAASDGCTHLGGVVDCSLGLLGVNGSRVVTMVVTPTLAGLITNTVVVSGGDVDPDPINNVATQTTTVDPAANLAIGKWADPDPVVAGSNLTYTLVVSNAGPSPAGSVMLQDTLPAAVVANNASGNRLLLHLDEPAGVVAFNDASGNDHNGSCTGTTCPAAGGSGRFGTALSFDGTNDFVSLGNPAGLNLAGEITLMAWVNPTVTTGLRDILAHGYTLSPPGTVFLRINNGQYEAGSWDGTNHLVAAAIPPGDAGNWVHLAGVYDGAAWRLYRNGSLVGTGVDPVGAVSVSGDWAVGARGGGTERFFNGLIDEVAIYDRAMAATEVAALYGQALAGSVSTSRGRCSAAAGVASCNLGSLAAPDTVTVTLRVTVAASATGLITNMAGLFSATFDPDLSNNLVTATTLVQALGSISVTKTATPPPGSLIQAGSAITYTIRVTNTGTTTVTNVRLSDPLDPNVTLIFSTTTPPGVVTGPAPWQVTWPSLAPGSSAEWLIGVRVNSPLAIGTVITNVVTGSSTESGLPVTTAPITHTITVAPAFTLLKSAIPAGGSAVTPASAITYTIVLSNAGGPALNFVFTDTIPAGTAYLPGSAAVIPSLGSLNVSGNRVILTVPSFPAYSAVTATFVVSVTTSYTTTLSNQAVATSGQSGWSSNVVTHTVRGTSQGKTYLPLIIKEEEPSNPPTIGLSWNSLEPVRDKVRGADGGGGLTPDGKTDGLFRLQVNMESAVKTVDRVTLASSQAATVIWDTIPGNGPWVLGIFDGGTSLNESDGAINQMVSGLFVVTLYASDTDPASLFPPDTYTYTVTVHFTDGSTLSAQARIPPPAPPPKPPSPTPSPTPTPECMPKLLATVGVGNTPRGITVDTLRSNRAYVANFGGGSLSVIQGTAVAQTVTGLPAANGVAYDPTNDLIWVTNYSTNQVTPVQAASLTPLAPVNVGQGPWGVTYNPANNYVYVVNSLANSVTVVNAASRAVVATLDGGGSFNQPFHIAANPATGKVYVANFGSSSVTVIEGTGVKGITSLADSTQPYGVAVDETRGLVYLSTVNSHRIVVVGKLNGVEDQLLGWAAFHRGFNDPARPVPLRVLAINPAIGPAGDGGHIWTVTSTADGSEANQALLVPKGWSSYFHMPIARDVGSNPSEGVAIDRSTHRVYISSGTSAGTVTILQDGAYFCLMPFAVEGSFGLDLHVVGN